MKKRADMVDHAGGRSKKASTYRPLVANLLSNVSILPIILIIALVVFSCFSSNFLTVANMMNVLRQCVFLMIVSLGQTMVLLTGGFDLSVGTIVAITSVVSAKTMVMILSGDPNAVVVAIVVGCTAGLAAALAIGFVNGLGVAFGNVSPFIMTLGMSSVGFGVALLMTGGTPVYGMPPAFGDVLGFGAFLNIPMSVWVTVGMVAISFVLVNMTKFGRTLYAVGGNMKAALLAGVPTRRTLLLVYVLSAAFAAVSGILLTARLDSGEANIGSSLPLESIAACVISGVSLRGGIGRMQSVVAGAFFIVLVQNGMNLARFSSYLQTVVIGCILILAVLADQIRRRLVQDS